MALSFELNTSNELEFSDFISRIEKKIDRRDPQCLLDCVEDLQQLTNNDHFVTDMINEELASLDTFQKGNGHSIQSLMLFRNRDFYIRLNAWPMLSKKEEVRNWQEYLYHYLRAHDHNFWFLTAGYFGGGYETDIWEYDPDSVLGFPGETVEMNFLGRTSLPKGKAMIYRASRDIHSQIAPKEFSLSLNIMIMSNDLLEREQYYFDTENKRIIGNTNTSLSTRFMMIDLATQFGNAETEKLLEKIAVRHKLPHIRMKSYQAWARLSDDKETIWKKALTDSSKVVFETAKKNLLFINEQPA